VSVAAPNRFGGGGLGISISGRSRIGCGGLGISISGRSRIGGGGLAILVPEDASEQIVSRCGSGIAGFNVSRSSIGGSGSFFERRTAGHPRHQFDEPICGWTGRT
jgi:hypothetical protein